MKEESALYRGHVLHRRLRPCVHVLRYRVLHMLLDIDRIDALAARLRLFSRGRFNLFAFHDSDVGDGTALRPHAERLLRDAGMEPDGGRILLLTMPRILGYAFNPLSTWFCHGADGALRAVIYEVSNTFGERHNYVIAAQPGATTLHQSSAKRFHVSPFLPMDLHYAFRVQLPGERLGIGITVSDAQGPVLAAVHSAQRQDLTDAALFRSAIAVPFATLKVTSAIHWEALKLWLKRAPLFRKPPPPAQSLTVGQ